METVNCFHANAALALTFHARNEVTFWPQPYHISCSANRFLFFSYFSLTCDYVSAASTERVVHQLVNVGIHASYRVEQCGLPLPRLPIRRFRCI